MKTTQKGFTLIEMMIVVAIIGILQGIAVPRYDAYMAKAHRNEATATLTQIQLKQENYAANNSRYAKDISTLNLGSAIQSDYYTYKLEEVSLYPKDKDETLAYPKLFNDTTKALIFIATATAKEPKNDGCDLLVISQTEEDIVYFPKQCFVK